MISTGLRLESDAVTTRQVSVGHGETTLQQLLALDRPR
jgi:hypothetical protein